MLGLWLVSILSLGESSGSQLGGTIAAASVGNGRRPHPLFCSNRLRFWPEAVTRASQLTLQSRRKRKRRMPCQSLASANSGSTHTLRLFMAFLYADVWWKARTRSKASSATCRLSRRPVLLVVQWGFKGQLLQTLALARYC